MSQSYPKDRREPWPGLVLCLAALLFLVACSGPAEVVETPPATDTLPPIPSVAKPTAVPSPTETPPPTLSPTPLPSDTPPPTDTAVPVTPSPTPQRLNGVSMNDVIQLQPDVLAHAREIYELGQELGRDPNAFSRLGASIVATHHFLGRWDYGPYDLGPYAYLEPTLAHYAGSFERVGAASLNGLTAVGVFDPIWAIDEACDPGETVIACEFRVHNPSLIFIVLGTNDKWDAEEFDQYLHEVVIYAMDEGVIPILATKADRFEGEDNRNNAIIRGVAADLRLPLWDFDLLADTLPGRGMGSDNVHLTLFDYYDYNMPEAFETGYGLYNLTALMMLDALRQQVAPEAEPTAEAPA